MFAFSLVEKNIEREVWKERDREMEKKEKDNDFKGKLKALF